MSKEKLRETGTLYYEEMTQIDSYYRNLNQGSDPEVVSIRLLQEVEQPEFWPNMLDFNGVEIVAKLLSETKGNSSQQLQTCLITEDNVDRFLSKVMRLYIN